MISGVYIGPAGQFILVNGDSQIFIKGCTPEDDFEINKLIKLTHKILEGWDYLGPLDCSYRTFKRLTGVECYGDTMEKLLDKASKKPFKFSEGSKKEITKDIIKYMRDHR